MRGAGRRPQNRLQFWLVVLLSLTTNWVFSAAPIIVHVQEPGPNSPIREAKVSVTIGTKRVAEVSEAGGDCHFDLALVPGCRIDVEKNGFCPLRWEVSAADVARQKGRFVFVLRLASKFGGSIVDEAGAPVSGARIAINFPQRLSGPHVPLDDLASVSDASGRWTADFVPADVAFVHLDVTEPNHQWQESQPDLQSLRDEKVVLKMTTLLALRGRVIDPSGKPVAGALVYRGNEWGIMGLGNAESAQTAADGTFSFQSGETGKIQIAVWDSQFGAVIQSIDLVKGMAPIELRLTAPHPRRFLVTDLDGHPLANVDVRVSDWESFHYPPQEFKTGPDGRIVFTNAPAGRIQMDFTEEDHFGLIMWPVSDTEAEQVIQLGPPLHLHGTVTDSKTGKPVPEFKMTPGWPRSVFQGGQMTNQGGEWAPYQTKAFHDGSYDWTFTRHVIVGTEKPNDFLLRVEADGYGASVSRVIKATEKDAVIDFALAPADYHTNRLQFADGSPASGKIGESKAHPKIEVAEPSDHNPVTVAIAFEKAVAHPGDIIDVIIRARIADAHHIYAMNLQNSGTFTPTAIDLQLPEDLEWASDWSHPNATRLKDELVYTKEAIFHRSVKVRANAIAGKLSIKGQLRCQACNDQLCWPPKDLPLVTTINIEAPSKGIP